MGRPPRRGSLVAAILTGAVLLSGCGADGGAPTAAVPATPTTSPERVGLVAAVCAQTSRLVPEVPAPDAPTAEGRRYLQAVVRASETLAADLDRLAARGPERRAVLEGLARRHRAVAATARRSADGRAAAGAANDLAAAIARLNLAATREGLPQCGL